MASEVGDDPFTQSQTSTKRGLKTTVQSDDNFFTISTRNVRDRRKFPFDVGGAELVDVRSWSVTKADRMSAAEAGAKLQDLLRMFKIERHDPEICAAFFESLVFCMAVNSSSVLTPDRATFSVRGTTFKFLEVVFYLREDLRRFFRAYADETVEILRALLAHPDQHDYAIRDKCDLIRSVALDRGLTRFPHLIADNAEMCTNLPTVEHTAITSAKASKLEEVINVADRLRTGSNPKTYRSYDSTNGEFVDK